jgi:PIN like domain
MPPDRRNLRFFFDESVLGVGKAMAIVRQDAIHVGHPMISSDIPLGTKDPVWIPWVAVREWIVVGRDRRIRSKPAELAAFRDHRLRVFWIAGKRTSPVGES